MLISLIGKGYREMKVAMRDIVRRRYSDYRVSYMDNPYIACLIASEELDIPIDRLYSFRCYPGCLFISVEIR